MVSGAEVGHFPITVEFPGEAPATYISPADLESEVEFLRDPDWPYIATDSNGKRLRLILERLELLLCTVVPVNFEPTELRVVRVDDVSGAKLVETDGQGNAFRSLMMGRWRSVKAVEPTQWNTVLTCTSSPSHPAPHSPQWFNERWLRARLGRFP